MQRFGTLSTALLNQFWICVFLKLVVDIKRSGLPCVLRLWFWQVPCKMHFLH